jgi:hypothetical protein
MVLLGEKKDTDPRIGKMRASTVSAIDRTIGGEGQGGGHRFEIKGMGGQNRNAVFYLVFWSVLEWYGHPRRLKASHKIVCSTKEVQESNPYSLVY